MATEIGRLLVVVAAFDRDPDSGELKPSFDAKQFDTVARAKVFAAQIADRHDGVIGWSREADPAIGEYGPSTVFFRRGDIPDLE